MVNGIKFREENIRLKGSGEENMRSKEVELASKMEH
jgi:hypothetical protein